MGKRDWMETYLLITLGRSSEFPRSDIKMLFKGEIEILIGRETTHVCYLSYRDIGFFN
jgi:hypothetical protein